MSTRLTGGQDRPTLTVIEGGKVTEPDRLEERLAQLHAEARSLLAMAAEAGA